MTNSKVSMVALPRFFFTRIVRMGNNHDVKVNEKGNTWIKVKSERINKTAGLIYVLYVPALGKNLFSVSAVTSRDNSVVFEKEKCSISKSSGADVGIGNLQGKLLTLDDFMQPNHEAKFASQQTEYLWHKTYGYMSQNNLRILPSNNLVKVFQNR